MPTLAELKSSEITLRNNLEREKTKVFRDDMISVYRFTQARRRLAERRAGIRGVRL